MYEFLKGTLREKKPGCAIVECGGVGYRCTIPVNVYMHLPALHQEVLLYLSQVVREDAHSLYGFLSQEDRDLFEKLLTVSGIGPKSAVSILGHLESSQFYRTLALADVARLSKIPGIGKKTAERLIVDLKGMKEVKRPLLESASVAGDAVSALMQLGYNPLEADQAVQSVLAKKSIQEVSELISAALSVCKK